MGTDVCTLVRNDHDDIDRAFGVIIDPFTAPRDLVEMHDVMKLAMSVHAAAEARVLQLLVARTSGSRVISMIAAATRLEHVEFANAVGVLGVIRPGSVAWYEHAIELRARCLDHALRCEQLRWTLRDHAPDALPFTLASTYATQRMLILTTSSPARVAEQRDAFIDAA